MRRTLLLLLPALLSASAFAATDGFDIRLGKAPTPPRPVDQAKVGAVERFLTARQAGTQSSDRRGEARSLLAARADDNTLFGPRGATLVAYNFHDGSIRPAGRGGFQADVYLLFAGRNGVVVESRDETLTFAARGKGYVCTSIRATGAIAWDADAVTKLADAIGVPDALARAVDALRAWTQRQRGTAAFSVADVWKTKDGTVLVQCLRFTASRGRRGFDAQDSTIVLRREGPDGYRVEAD
ncbi:MAG TPA: hypothetical protein VID50_10640 [Candidatus Eisenbacteria bacterium]|jgi:hypothetical protein